MKRIAALMIAALLAGGCAGSPGTPAPAGPASPAGPANPAAPPAPPAPPAPASPAVASDGPIQCGREVNRHDQGYDPAARECLWQAYEGGRPADFSMSELTEEGDPIIWQVGLVSRDRIQVSVDVTQDRFSSPEDRKVTLYTCTQMARDNINREGQARIRLWLSGCDGGPNKELGM